jgi:hypothetical protein
MLFTSIIARNISCYRVRKIYWSFGSCPSSIVLFTIIDRKRRSNRVRKITNPVELSLLHLRHQALNLHNRVRKSVAIQKILSWSSGSYPS